MTTTLSRKRASRVVRAAFLSGASTLALCALASPAFAQDAPAAAPAADEQVVTIRGSLQRSMNIKKNAVGIVDAISAEDIGKYPDTNLAESIQRIPGVAINRVNGEGSEVTVRGFGPAFNLTTLNGRTLPTANIQVVGADTGDFAGGGTRNFDFGNIASDGVSGFEVYKTGRANIPSGGLGATMNIKTLRPIGKAGAQGSITVKALHGDGMVTGDEWTPEVSGAYSWANDSNTMGVSIFGAHSVRDVATRSSTQNSWNLDYFAARPAGITAGGLFLPSGNGRLRYVPAANPNDPPVLASQITNRPPNTALVSYPNDSRYHFSENHSERTNVQLTAQWRPMENLLLTFDALYATSEVSEQRSDQTNWFNRPFDKITFEQGDSGVYNAVYLEETLSGTKDIGFEQQMRATKDTLSSVGLNAQWDLSDRMTVTFDLAHSKGEALPNNPNGTTSTMVSIGAPVVSQHSVDFRGDVPVQKYTVNDGLPVYRRNPAGILVNASNVAITDANGNYLTGFSAADRVITGYRGNNNGKLDAGDLGSQVARKAVNSQTHQIDEARVDFTYDFDGESRVDFGVDWIKSEMTTTTGSTYHALGDWGISNPGDVAQYAPGLIETFDLGGLFQDFTPGQSNIAFRANAIDLYAKLAKGYNQNIPEASLTANTIEEDIKAVYGQFTMKGDLVGFPTTVVAGMRYEKTDVTASALQSIPTAIRWTADNDFAQNFGTGVATYSLEASYDNWLPNIDVVVSATDQIKVRASYSKTIARAPYGAMYATTTVNNPPRPTLNGVNPTATVGNPALLPFESSNIDVSAEWYYGPSNYVSIGFYNKDVANFITSTRVQSNHFGLRDPSSGANGSRSGTARTLLGGINQSTTDVNLFTMTALLIKHNGNTGLATTEYQANLDGGNLTQSYVDSILAAYDVVADAQDPLFMFETSTNINSRSGNVHGMELAFQHFLGDTGFGLSGSLTTVKGDVNFDNSAPPGTTQFALLGLSDTFNVTLIYDKGPLSGRLSYNWRDEYLVGTGRDGAAGNPTYVEEFGVIDASVNYQLTPQVQLTFEGLNLGKEHLRTHGRDKVNMYYAQELDTRYQVGVRYKF
ncbi:tonB-dependent receptor family protein [Asticcacaulis biprosthecium C19]|uniref:TonB-dependent receptor family protein n=1 Tax=Asticcacaulis biprosthecium C19 TaxID=715226 RepID=F4QLP5_9CAUL|nr:TonB-dependent receptor [Asticcacaulis biprosthecium]EGF93543.1 tonB-dependent receptor family protein [Asticcacaulis biprosthecium C19]